MSTPSSLDITSTAAAGGARLVITNQESPEQEAIYKNGENKQLHSVIKNVPFIIDLGLVGDFDKNAINFNKCTLEATLMYDSSEDKPVHYVSRRPVEYNCTVDKSSAGDRVKVECTLNVLSSQHEGAYFRLRFTAASLALHVLSEPIRVVSKPLQLKKVKEQRKAAAAAAAAAAQSKNTASASAGVAASRKRPLTDSIQDTLSRIEAQQEAQQNLISSLFQTVMAQLPLTPASSAASSAPNTPLSQVSSPFCCPSTPSSSSSVASPVSSSIFAQPAAPSSAKRRRLSTAPAPETAAFEGHLRGLIKSFHAIGPSSRAQAVRSAVASSSAMQVEQLSGLVDVLCAEGLGRTTHISLISGQSASAFGSRGGSSYHPWQLSSANSPLICAGADASDVDEFDAAACSTETWTSPSSTSPMSPGQEAAASFSFDSIEAIFGADGGAPSRKQSGMSLLPAVGELEAYNNDELYNEFFSDQGWLLEDQGEASSSF
jgi:hypothetical protein